MRGPLALGALGVGGVALVAVLFLPPAQPMTAEGTPPCLSTLESLAGKEIPGSESGEVPADLDGIERGDVIDAGLANSACQAAAAGRLRFGVAVGIGVAVFVYVVGMAMNRTS